MPVVPQVDIDGLGGLGEKHQQIHTQADWNDEGADCGVIGHRCSCRPAHIEDLELQSINLHDLGKCRSEGTGQEAGDY